MTSMPAVKNDHQNVASEAFLELGVATDQFERYANPHATRIAALADEMGRRLGLGEQDRRSLHPAAARK